MILIYTYLECIATSNRNLHKQKLCDKKVGIKSKIYIKVRILQIPIQHKRLVMDKGIALKALIKHHAFQVRAFVYMQF